eukprot:141914_1
MSIDMDDIIIKYGNPSKLIEYIDSLPLSIQIFISIFNRFKYCLNECHKIDMKYYINDFNIVFESGYSYIGYYFGFMIAKGIYSLHPRFINITPSLLELNSNDSKLFINTLQSMAKWSKLFLNKYYILNKCNNKIELVDTLKISISCIAQITVKMLSEFCVGDGTDLRLINALEIFVKHLGFKHIYLNIETMIPKN